jgi:hypothetical protein
MPLKVLLYIFYQSMLFVLNVLWYPDVLTASKGFVGFLFRFIRECYLAGFAVVFILQFVCEQLVPELPFLPILLTSVYAAIGIFACSLTLFWKLVLSE